MNSAIKVCSRNTEDMKYKNMTFFNISLLLCANAQPDMNLYLGIADQNVRVMFVNIEICVSKSYFWFISRQR